MRHLSVPVHDAAGQVLLVLRLGALPAGVHLAQIRLWLARLQQAAARLETTLAAQPQLLRA